MSVWLALLHLLNFIAPAAGMAVFLALGEVVSKRKWPSLLDGTKVLAVYFLAGVGALMLGLALLSRDGISWHEEC